MTSMNPRGKLERALALGFFLAVLPVSSGTALTANTYDEASANPFVMRDRTGGGDVVAEARSSKTTGIMSATVTATSDSPVGSPYLVQPFIGGIGGNQAKSISSLAKYFDFEGDPTEHTVTVSVTVSEPLAASAFLPSPNFMNDLTQEITGSPGPYLGTYASAYVALAVNAYFADNPGGGVTKYRYITPYSTSSDPDVLLVGTYPMVVTVHGTGKLVVRIHLEASAVATGDKSRASAFCSLSVAFIEVI